MARGFSAGADGVLLPDMGSVRETRLRRAAQWSEPVFCLRRADCFFVCLGAGGG